MTQIIIHADDLGISEGITRGILKGCDSHVLSSVSIVPNGFAFEYAIEEVKKRPYLRLSTHLNFLEGFPVSEPKEIHLLVDKNGKFCHSFVGLWMKYNQSSFAGKNILKQQVKTEIKAQIRRVMGSVGSHYPMNIDSHNHYHMIPFIFEALLELTEELKIDYVRVPEERFFWCLGNRHAYRAYLGSNIIKHYVLNCLSGQYKRRLDQLSIQYPRYFIGVLFSGCMSGGIVQAALKSMEGRRGIIEVLFHPGRAQRGELKQWVRRGRFDDYYCSPRRDYELEELTNPSFRRLIEQYGGPR